jgi:hypothetical protein
MWQKGWSGPDTVQRRTTLHQTRRLHLQWDALKSRDYCAANGGLWSYSQGAILGGIVELFKAIPALRGELLSRPFAMRFATQASAIDALTAAFGL